MADSQAYMKSQNIESLRNLEQNLDSIGGDFASLPLVLQYNKRDLEGSDEATMSIKEMKRDLNPFSRWASFQASALYGKGVKETFRQVCVATVEDVYQRMLS